MIGLCCEGGFILDRHRGDDYYRVLYQRIERLKVAIHKLLQPTRPRTPLPRPKAFWLTSTFVWPACLQTGYNSGSGWEYMWNKDHKSWVKLTPPAVDELLLSCEWQDRKVFQLIRRLDAATSWCYARREGRERMAEEIVRQQRSWARKLDVIIATDAMDIIL